MLGESGMSGENANAWLWYNFCIMLGTCRDGSMGCRSDRLFALETVNDMQKTILERAARIRMVVFDVDGVLTDGKLYFTHQGEELKAFCSRDGHGMKMLGATGVELALITGRRSRCVEYRAADLGITRVYQGATDKLQVFGELLAETGLDAMECACVGDDVVDLPVMLRSGLAICVPAAPALVKQHAHYVTRLEGGNGAVREVCELIMRARNTLDSQLAGYLQ